jgi:hypothetical protein
MTLLDLIFIAVVVAVVVLARRSLGRARREQEATERQYLGTMTRLTWMLVNERPSKVVYFTKAQVDESIDVPHLQLELTPNGYALKALDAPSQDATSCINLTS